MTRAGVFSCGGETPAMLSNRDAMLAITLTSGLGPRLTQRCLMQFQSAQAVLVASASDLATIEGVGTYRADEIRRNLDKVISGSALERENALIAEHNVSIVTVIDDDYPKLLRHISDPPPLLYVRGRLIADDVVALGVVGSRHCTQYGREQADRLAGLCAQHGLTIVSGGAKGIDGAAHRAALTAKGRTIAVIGSGLTRPYPPDHVELFDQIAQSADVDDGNSRGAVISELPMTTPPKAENFPSRNRIISGMSLGVLVVEAAVRSGALITARLCIEDHNRDLMAVPGRIDSPYSAGCNKIIREGWATLVTCSADILDALGETGQLLKAGLDASELRQRDREAKPPAAVPASANVSQTQKQLLGALTGPRTLDELITAAELPIAVVQADLTMLEIRSMIKRDQGRYIRV